MLLNRRVICVPFGSKFYGFGEPLELRPPWKLDLDNIENLTLYPGYLARCRDQNLRFKAKVIGYLKEQGAL